MIWIDFNLSLNFGQYTFTDLLKNLASACRTDNFLTTVGLPSKKEIRQMRSTILGILSGENFFLFRSVSLYGICLDSYSIVIWVTKDCGIEIYPSDILTQGIA
jgi:hypothetical protein